MSFFGSMTPSTSDKGGVIMQGIPLLPEVVVEEMDFLGYYEGDWGG